MSPRSTFHKVGSSSRLVERRKRPRRVRRTESVVSKSSLARGGRMVRNLRSIKSFPCRPGRAWQKRTGAPRCRRTVIDTTASTGSRSVSPRSDARMSRRRVKLNLHRVHWAMGSTCRQAISIRLRISGHPGVRTGKADVCGVSQS